MRAKIFHSYGGVAGWRSERRVRTFSREVRPYTQVWREREKKKKQRRKMNSLFTSKLFWIWKAPRFIYCCTDYSKYICEAKPFNLLQKNARFQAAIFREKVSFEHSKQRRYKKVSQVFFSFHFSR